MTAIRPGRFRDDGYDRFRMERAAAKRRRKAIARRLQAYRVAVGKLP